MFNILKKTKEALLVMEDTMVDLDKDITVIQRTLARSRDKQRELSNVYRSLNESFKEAAGGDVEEIDRQARESHEQKKKSGFFKLKH